jgi:acyl-coenzyme A synthetase/AMP-(fatty) acid ligase
MAYLPMESALQKKGSIGIPIPGGRFELIDGDGRVMEGPGETGELVYYGDNVTYGYATCGEDLIREDDNRGRLATGDMARRDEDGYYYIVGRMKRFIKMFGNRINLDDVDTVLKKKLNTLDVVSSGKDDFLDIFVTDGALAETVYDFVFETFGINRKKMKVHVIGEIPHNASGKILYSQLEALKDDGE